MPENPLLTIAKKQLNMHHWSVEDAEVLIQFIRDRTNTAVVQLDFKTKQPVPVESVLVNALLEHRQNPFSRVVVLGDYDDPAKDEYEAASEADAAINNWMADRFKFTLQKNADNV